MSAASVVEWRSELSELHARLGELFVRSEPRRQAGLYLEGLLSAVERKNGWQLAEHLRALARVSRVLRDDAIRQKLRGADNPDALYALLTDRSETHVT